MIAELPEGLKFEADELLNSAIMSKVPVVIVEGCDDIPIYERLALSVGRECEIYASENILSGKPGCFGVIEHLDTIRSNSDGMDISPYVLGVIDRDARCYRDEIPVDGALLVLNLYSIESHFVSSEAVRVLVERTTRATNNLTTVEDAEKLFDGIKVELEKLYLYSLEAMRKACDRGYEGRFGYSDRIKAILNSGHEQGLLAKKDELEAFAQSKGITSDWSGLLAVCKGKWLLEVFIDEFKRQVGLLPGFCGSGEINKCQSCVRAIYKNCLYKVTANFDSPQLHQMLMQDVDLSSLEYIKARFETLVS
ncbi:hypothetical protein [Pseudomonas sp. BEA3.1]|uniref:hypothetical protein n=1 Tax=Pseudomonas sp. BEA3.1 TaxID=3083251 RepID=UPI00296426BB|nr:hypothetical protein [Pseudomonas sp. BEA3.1]MDW2779760.1 hypothetical protein [Pseudomonas sp. BEA3.1]